MRSSKNSATRKTLAADIRKRGASNQDTELRHGCAHHGAAIRDKLGHPTRLSHDKLESPWLVYYSVQPGLVSCPCPPRRTPFNRLPASEIAIDTTRKRPQSLSIPSILAPDCPATDDSTRDHGSWLQPRLPILHHCALLCLYCCMSETPRLDKRHRPVP